MYFTVEHLLPSFLSYRIADPVRELVGPPRVRDAASGPDPDQTRVHRRRVRRAAPVAVAPGEGNGPAHLKEEEEGECALRSGLWESIKRMYENVCVTCVAAADFPRFSKVEI